MGVVREVWKDRRNLYVVYWFDGAESTILPRAILRKVKEKKQ